MTRRDSEDVEAVAAQLEEYILNHPNAADTLEGITTWWLARQQYVESRLLVQKALDRLLEKGVLRKEKSAHGSMLYSKRETR